MTHRDFVTIFNTPGQIEWVTDTPRVRALDGKRLKVVNRGAFTMRVLEEAPDGTRKTNHVIVTVKPSHDSEVAMIRHEVLPFIFC